jgi:hypothetical protein
MRNIPKVLVPVVAVMLLASSCGGDPRLTKSGYERSVNQIGEQLADTLSTTFSSPELQNPDTLKEAADVIRVGQRNIGDAAGRLDRLNPPDEIESIHKQLAAGFRGFARAFGTFAQATEKGDLAAIQTFNQQVSDRTLPAMVQIQRAIDQLKAKGYDISSE